ncbi:run domain Beclin-1-interacting and cysteine-rich domain-containing protein isoform X1 [Diabrotica undecimpunctata]|uniref:run domain Beclin-1-interacting and cysteine-rich domain-containing protein isoform X1 n=1 Tax=Diabrotica undecimpunctata TaxID=50387 RepID=UPI003B6322A9
MNESSQYTLKYQQLLRDLKSTVEGLLMTQVANVWSVFGGLNRFHNIVDKIFKHGYKGSEDEIGYYKFIQGLEWLQPETSKSYLSVDCEYRPHIPPHLKNDKSAIWLYRSLENHSLSQKLSWLLSDKTHLSNCYQSYAFLTQEKYAEATLICLRAVERNQASLMSEINPYLFLQKPKEFLKVHRRCSSFPDNHMQKIYAEKINIRRRTVQSVSDELMEATNKINIRSKIRTWHSMPNLLADQRRLTKKRPCSDSKTMPNTPVHSKKISPSLLKVDYKTLQPHPRKSNSKKIKQNTLPKASGLKHVLIDNLNIVEYTPSLSSSQSSGTTLINDELISSTASTSDMKTKSPLSLSQSPLSMVDSFLPMSGEKDYKKLPRKTFIEDGGMSVLPMATGYFPKPVKGQSLMSFLTSSQFARANAELDRENAHFSVSEAIISAMEQIRCKKSFRLAEEQMDESDPEIMDLKQKIRLRRTKRVLEKQKKSLSCSLMSDGKTDTTTTVSPCSSTASGTDDSSSDYVEELEINETSNLEENSGLSMSMASLYSEADLMRRNIRGAPDGSSDILSAEGVALSLISKFSDKQLPRASDLEWLVSEKDAPQALLPLPKSWPVSPDSADEHITPLRGTEEWAPPRAQIIFTLHPTPIRKDIIAKQNYRCAGCSMRVAPKYASRFRYCEYLGRFFCTGCHKNQVALIPAKVIQKWDFKSYPVSTFSYRLLEQMYTDPLFRIFSVNKNIGKMSKSLEFYKKLRLGLHYLKDFILTCRYAEQIRATLEESMGSSLADPDMYSMDDLCKIRSGELIIKLKFLVDICCKHTSECQLCLARGFICEFCGADEVIFPWQMRSVSRCDKCGTCYHMKCWSRQVPCKKCLRIQRRKESTDSSSSR